MRRHSLDAVSLVFGLMFVGLGATYLAGYSVNEVILRFWPAALIALGLAILLTPRRNRQAVPAAGSGSPSVGSAPARPASPGEPAPAPAAPPVPSGSQPTPPPASTEPPA